MVQNNNFPLSFKPKPIDSFIFINNNFKDFKIVFLNRS